jgi:hypothetical protein
MANSNGTTSKTRRATAAKATAVATVRPHFTVMDKLNQALIRGAVEFIDQATGAGFGRVGHRITLARRGQKKARTGEANPGGPDPRGRGPEHAVGMPTLCQTNALSNDR